VRAGDSYDAFQALSSVVIAEFDRCGKLLHGNAGLLRLNVETPISIWQLVTQPLPDSILNVLPDSDGRIYSGIITIRGPGQSMISLTGAIYLEPNRILLLAGYDMNEFEAMAATLLELNEEITQAYRNLARANRDLECREREIRELSLTDPLTGVGNRRRLDDSLNREVEHAARYKHSLSLVMLDIDHFKQVNDTWGHEAGDHVLKETGAALLTISRKADIVTRMGGEEFVVLLPSTDLAEAVACAERLRGALEVRDFGLPRLVTSSFGVSSLLPGESGTSLLARADAALYAAKQQGRNRVVAARSEGPP
jgi:two-component system cell cycle response regulator